MPEKEPAVSALPVDISSIEVVLVNTSHSGNIGAVARAMKNMTLNRLCLVQPKEFPSHEAERRASGAVEILDQARVVDSLDEAIGDAHIVVGASARTRSMPWPLMNPRDCAEMIIGNLSEVDSEAGKTRVALLFGRESSGLTNEELQRCHYHVNIPANPDYSSLNLAMAVQVISYEIRMTVLLAGARLGGTNALVEPVLGPESSGWDEEKASVSEVEGFIVHLEETLVKIGFHDPANPRMLMTRLRRLFQRAQLDKMEVNILRGILKNVLKSNGNR